MPDKFQASRFNNIIKIAKSVDPRKYSIYRLFFETQGRKHGRNLTWSCTYEVSIRKRCIGTYDYSGYQLQITMSKKMFIIQENTSYKDIFTEKEALLC